MTWTLEFRRIGTDEWRLYTQGTLEECLEDALELKAGLDGLGNSYDAARLGFEREPREDQPKPVTSVYSGAGARAVPFMAVHPDGRVEQYVKPAHTHTWIDDRAVMAWKCSDRLECGAFVTYEDVLRAGGTSVLQKSDQEAIEMLRVLWEQHVEREAQGREGRS